MAPPVELARELVDQPEHQVRVVEVRVLQERLVGKHVDRGEAGREIALQAEQLGGLAAAAVPGERRQRVAPLVRALLLDVLAEQPRDRASSCPAERST